MPGSSHLGVFCRARSIVKESLSDRFKFFFDILAESSLHFPKKKRRKRVEVPKQKTSSFCN